MAVLENETISCIMCSYKTWETKKEAGGGGGEKWHIFYQLFLCKGGVRNFWTSIGRQLRKADFYFFDLKKVSHFFLCPTK